MNHCDDKEIKKKYQQIQIFKKMKMKQMHEYKIFQVINQQIFSLYVLKYLQKTEHMILYVNDTIICKIFSGRKKEISNLAPLLKYHYDNDVGIIKLKKHISCINMENIFDRDYEHNFFEILMLLRIVYTLYEKSELKIHLLNAKQKNIVIQKITSNDYCEFKHMLRRNLNNTNLSANVEFEKKLLLIDYDFFNVYVYDFKRMKIYESNDKIYKINMNLLNNFMCEMTEYIYDKSLNGSYPSEEQIICNGPRINSLDKFKFFMNKHKSFIIYEFLDEPLKKSNDVMMFMLSKPYLNLMDMSKIFNYDVTLLLSIMLDNELINDDNLALFIDNNKMIKHHLEKLFKYEIQIKQNIDVKFINKYNNFKKVSKEITTIGKHIFDKCAICINKFTCYPNKYNDGKLMRVTCCNKLMHKNCAEEWKFKMRTQQLKCPLCCVKIRTHEYQKYPFMLIKVNNPIIYIPYNSTRVVNFRSTFD
jgi:hypothetical protein